MKWTEAETTVLEKYRDEKSISELAAMLKKSRKSVASKIRRMDTTETVKSEIELAIPKKVKLSISKVNAAARAEGLTYGQYVAKYDV